MSVTIDRLRQVVNNNELRTFSIEELEDAFLLLNRNLAADHFQKGQHEILRDSVKTLLVLRTNERAIKNANIKTWIAVGISVFALVLTAAVNWEKLSILIFGAPVTAHSSLPTKSTIEAPNIPTK